MDATAAGGRLDGSPDVQNLGGMLRVIGFLSMFLASPALSDAVEVDLELVLLVDVSHSMSARELEIQRQGYAEALRSYDVYYAIQSGLLQRIALTYVEWAGAQEVIVDWQVVETRADLDAFAGQLTANYVSALRRTSISRALEFGAELIEANSYRGLRRVIDVSGDGPNNLGAPVLDARADVLEKGITINGLPLMTDEGAGSQWHLDDLDIYYQSCVTGGPGSFVVPVLDWQDFGDAVRKKLVLEIAGLWPHADILPAQFSQAPAYDCLIGEKIWARNERYWTIP